MLQNTKYVINLITKYVIKHVTIIKTKMCGLSVACVLDPVMSDQRVGSTSTSTDPLRQTGNG